LRKDLGVELNRLFDVPLYTFVRLSLEYCECSLTPTILDEELGCYEVLSAIELRDEEWELVVLRSYMIYPSISILGRRETTRGLY
jgi:hypothetical protein